MSVILSMPLTMDFNGTVYSSYASHRKLKKWVLFTKNAFFSKSATFRPSIFVFNHRGERFLWRDPTQHSDNQLVQLTLKGDQDAFSALVEKYQSQIHALVWRKIDDFHIAEDITQEVFLTAYQKLATLTHPDRFAKWLYVIANNLCVTWLRKQAAQPQLESLTSTDPEELAELCYAEYTAQQQAERGKESDRALIQKLLDKLREADRTVIRLYGNYRNESPTL